MVVNCILNGYFVAEVVESDTKKWDGAVDGWEREVFQRPSQTAKAATQSRKKEREQKGGRAA